MEVFEVAKLGVWVVHLKCNRPGLLGFSARLAGEGWASEIEGRRLLVGKKADDEARVWVFPMGSDVEPGEGGIVVRDEGEALVVAGPGGAELMARLEEVGIEEDRTEDVMVLLGRLRERR